MTISATVRNGRIELDEPRELPEGTALQILLPSDTELLDEDPESAEDIAEALAAMDRMEPLQMTDAEIAAWEEDRRIRREREKAQFIERAERMRGGWE